MGHGWGSPQPSGPMCALSGRREAKPSSLQRVRVGETRARAGIFREGQRGDMCAKTWGGQERAVGIEGKKHLASLSTGASEPEGSQQAGSPRQVSSERAQHQMPARGFWGQAGRGGARLWVETRGGSSEGGSPARWLEPGCDPRWPGAEDTAGGGEQGVGLRAHLGGHTIRVCGQAGPARSPSASKGRDTSIQTCACGA